MEISCSELRTRARENLKNTNYWNAFVVTVLGGAIASCLPLITTGPMMVGMAKYYTNIRDNKIDIQSVFSGFNCFGLSFLAYLLSSVFVFLWSLLLFVPGIIMSYAYAMVPYIVMDNPYTNPADAVADSKKLMDGYKWKLFKLQLSFIGWILLGLIFFGIGVIFVVPYMQATEAEFYQELLRCHNIEPCCNTESCSNE